MLSFKSTLNTTYKHQTTAIVTLELSRNHFFRTSAKAYGTLGLIHCTCKSSHPFEIKHKAYTLYTYLLYNLAVITYFPFIWQPYLITDINSLERIQGHATTWLHPEWLHHCIRVRMHTSVHFHLCLCKCHYIVLSTKYILPAMPQDTHIL